MNRFGELLRYYRRRCMDSERGGRPLTQERLGELLGVILGDSGYTGAAVSDWERSKSQIHKDQRSVLVALIRALREYGGLQSLTEASTLLLAGNYRPLDRNELSKIFSEDEMELLQTVQKPGQGDGQWRLIVMFIGELIFRPSAELRRLLSDTSQGPPPHWPRFLLSVLGRPGKNWSSRNVVQAVAWIGVWLLVWRLTFPLIDWPFVNTEQVRMATIIYIGGSLIAPLLIGGLTRTRDDAFWQQQNQGAHWVTRLYTYQGAMIGFHLGYMMVFAAALLGYYFKISQPPPLLLGAMAAWPVILGYAAARQVPFNLWRAFGRLHLADGGVFFIFILFGFLWGGFFFVYYPMLLSPSTGVIILLLSIGILAGIMAWQQNRTGSSVIPPYVWTGIFGALLVMHQAVSGAGLLLLVISSGIVITSVALMSWGYIHVTLKGAGGLLLWCGMALAVFMVSAWAGRIAVVMAAPVWWRWGRKYIWFPAGYWIVMIAAMGSGFLAQRGLLPEAQAAVLFGAINGVVLILTKRKPFTGNY